VPKSDPKVYHGAAPKVTKNVPKSHTPGGKKNMKFVYSGGPLFEKVLKCLSETPVYDIPSTSQNSSKKSASEGSKSSILDNFFAIVAPPCGPTSGPQVLRLPGPPDAKILESAGPRQGLEFRV